MTMSVFVGLRKRVVQKYETLVTHRDWPQRTDQIQHTNNFLLCAEEGISVWSNYWNKIEKKIFAEVVATMALL